MDIYLAKTQGFCAGVSYAISIVENALKKYGAPLYVYHEIVHNTFVVNQFKGQGVIFVEEVKAVPQGNRIIFSAHGVPPSSIVEARERSLKIIDATCPLVTKVHKEAVNLVRSGDVDRVGWVGLGVPWSVFQLETTAFDGGEGRSLFSIKPRLSRAPRSRRRFVSHFRIRAVHGHF